MNDFDIMTCGDQKYFKFLKIFEKNVFNRYHFFPIIYDLGLTEAQKKSLQSEIRIIPISQSFYMKNSSNYIQATHKPSCILDYLSYHNKNILYVDADTLFTSKFHHNLFKDIDIAITPRHRKERKKEYKRFYSCCFGIISSKFYAYGICTNRDILFQSGSVLV